MKFGLRKPSLKKSFKARTTGKLKRKVKKAINPFYGKKGMGYIKNPKRAVKNKIYNKTTFSWNNKNAWIHLFLFFTTAGIGNIIYLICKRNKQGKKGMICKYCGKEIDDKAVICVHCKETVKKTKFNPILIIPIAFILFIIMTISLCSGDSTSVDTDSQSETISMSGDLEYYAEIGADALTEKYEDEYIDVSGTVQSIYSNKKTIRLGKYTSDNIQFSCDLLNTNDINFIKIGDLITVHGKLNNHIGHTIYLTNCEIKKFDNKIESETTHNTTATNTTETEAEKTTAPSTTEANAVNTSDTKPITEPNTNPVHIHKFSAATCTSPKTCSCGATEGKANGHNWKSATCTTPKTCTVCGTTSGSASDHSWKNATYTSPKTCSGCGATEGNPLDVPGKENYHGHVYTGGDKSTKFHYESDCAGKYSHEITWDEAERRNLGPCNTCVLK